MCITGAAQAREISAASLPRWLRGPRVSEIARSGWLSGRDAEMEALDPCATCGSFEEKGADLTHTSNLAPRPADL